MCLYLCNKYILAPSNARTLRGCEKWHPLLSVWHPLGGPVDEIPFSGVAILWEIVVNAYPPTFCWCFEFHCHLDPQIVKQKQLCTMKEFHRPTAPLWSWENFGDGILHRVACQILLGLLNFSAPQGSTCNTVDSSEILRSPADVMKILSFTGVWTSQLLVLLMVQKSQGQPPGIMCKTL